MENKSELVNNQKSTNKAKSQYNGPPQNKVKYEPMRRKSFNVNDAVNSLDLALGRLKKGKLVEGAPLSPRSAWDANSFVNSEHSSHFPQGPSNVSLMSMNFSHYELMRNLSRSNCDSECTISGNTCNEQLNVSDPMIKNERLEKYFRSAEMWTQKSTGAGSPNTVHFEIPDE